MHVRDYKAEDVVIIQSDIIEVSALVPDIMQWAKLNELSGPGFTSVQDDVVTGVAGIRIVKEQVGEAWAAITPAFVVDIKLGLVLLRGILRIVTEMYDLKQITTVARTNFAKGHTLLKHLGFSRKSCIPGTIYTLYER